MLFKKRRSRIAWLIAGIWQLKGVRRNADKGRCPLCLEKEDVKHILLKCKETKYWREKIQGGSNMTGTKCDLVTHKSSRSYLNHLVIHDKWLNMNKEITYRKILKTTNRIHIQNLGKYLDIIKNKWFNTIKDT
jgi:hypothetical protein